MAIDQKRLAELKAAQIQAFTGETKITTEKHAVYAAAIDLSNPDSPRLAIYSRNEVTSPAGTVVHGESETTNVPLDPKSPPFQKSTTRGMQTGEMATVGDMLASLVGFSIDAVATRKATVLAEAEAALDPPPGPDEEIERVSVVDRE